MKNVVFSTKSWLLAWLLFASVLQAAFFWLYPAYIFRLALIVALNPIAQVGFLLLCAAAALAVLKLLRPKLRQMKLSPYLLWLIIAGGLFFGLLKLAEILSILYLEQSITYVLTMYAIAAAVAAVLLLLVRSINSIKRRIYAVTIMIVLGFAGWCIYALTYPADTLAPKTLCTSSMEIQAVNATRKIFSARTGQDLDEELGAFFACSN